MCLFEFYLRLTKGKWKTKILNLIQCLNIFICMEATYSMGIVYEFCNHEWNTVNVTMATNPVNDTDSLWYNKRNRAPFSTAIKLATLANQQRHLFIDSYRVTVSVLLKHFMKMGMSNQIKIQVGFNFKVSHLMQWF